MRGWYEWHLSYHISLRDGVAVTGDWSECRTRLRGEKITYSIETILRLLSQ